MEISFKLANGQAYEPAPFRIVAVGHFSGAEAGKGTTPTPISKADFDDVLAKTIGELVIEVENHLGTGDKELKLSLPFTAFKDFIPGNLAKNVPQLTAIGEFGEKVEDVARGKMTREAFGQWADSACAGMHALDEAIRLTMAQPGDGGGSGGGDASGGEGANDVMDEMLEHAGDAPKPASSALGGVINSIAGGGSKVSDEFKQAKALASQVLSKQLDAILRHETIRSLERTWRGLRWLSDKMDFREGNVKLDIVDTPRADLAERYEEVLYKPVYTGHQDTPGLVIVDFPLSTSTADMEQLQTFAEKAESVQMAHVFGISHDFFPGKTLEEVSKLPDPGTLFGETAFEKWNSIRGKETARWVAVGANPVQLRDPWTPENSRGVDYKEAINGSEDYLWGNPAYVIAAATARSFAKTSFPTEITGYEDGRFDGLPVRHISGPDSPQVPLQALLPEDQASELYKNGLIALAAEPNRDSLFILKAPSVHKPERTDDDTLNVANRRMAQLGYQLLMARMGEEIFRHKKILVGDNPEADPKALHDRCEAFLFGMFHNTGDGAGVAVAIQKDEENDRLFIQMRVRTGKKVLKGVDCQFGFFA